MKYNVIKKIISLILVGISVIISFSGCSKKAENEELLEKVEKAPADALSVVGIFPYSGQFVEDGSDDEVENIVAAVLVNNSSVDFEYVEFSVKTDIGVHSFTASTVKAGKTMTVLCKNKDKLENNESMQSFSIDIKAEYITPVSLAEGVLEIYYIDNSVSLKNASDRDLTGITVYYKQKNDMGYFGGITYKTFVPSLKSGEITQFNTEHIDEIVNIVFNG